MTAFTKEYNLLDLSVLSRIRTDVANWLKTGEKGFSHAFITDVILVTGEVAINSSEHGGDEKIAISLFSCGGQRLIVSIQAKSHLNPEVVARVVAIQSGIKFETGERSRGLAMACCLTQKISFSDEGHLIAVFLPDIPTPRPQLSPPLPIIW